MKRIIFLLTVIFICYGVYAETETINWYLDGDTYATTQCESGDDIVLPVTPISKKGYTFRGWGEYIPIEYIETTGDQYIATGYELTTYSRFEYDIAVTSRLNFTIGNGAFSFGFSGNILKIHSNAKDYAPCSISVDRERHTFIYDRYNDIVQIDDCAMSMNGELNNLSSPIVLYVGTWNIGNSAGTQVWEKNPARHYGYRIYERDVLVRDYVPALDKNGVPCLYEKIQKKFLYKSGSVDLIAGPIIDE